MQHGNATALHLASLRQTNKEIRAESRVAALEQNSEVNAAALNLLDWTLEHRKIKDQRTGIISPFSLDRYPWLNEIYRVFGEELRLKLRLVFRKPAQVGITEWAVSTLFWAIHQHRVDVFYGLPPGKTVASDFSSARINTAIDESAAIQAMATAVDNVGLKLFDRGALYIRSTNIPGGDPNKAPQLLSVPADLLIIDEFDAVPPAAVPLMRKRLGDSWLAAEIMLSTPTYPSIGIDAEYQKSDQRELQLECEHCGAWDWLIWDNVKLRGGRARYICPGCGGTIKRQSAWGDDRFRWVVRNPDSEVIGFGFSKLASPRASLDALWANSLELGSEKQQSFYNADLGIPYEPKGGRLTTDTLNGVLGDYTLGNTQTGKGCLMGVDIGTRIHVVIRQSQGERLRATYIGEVDDFEELDAFVSRYQVRAAVVDALPETRKAQEFAERFDGRVYVAYYATQPRGVKRASPYQWSENEHVVNIDRSRAFDGVLAGYYNKQYENPADAPTITDYYLHLRNLVRVKENLPDGTPVVRYLKLGPDHYAHAENYCLAANFAPFDPGTPPITTMFVGAQRKQG